MTWVLEVVLDDLEWCGTAEQCRRRCADARLLVQCHRSMYLGIETHIECDLCIKTNANDQWNLCVMKVPSQYGCGFTITGSQYSQLARDQGRRRNITDMTVLPRILASTTDMQPWPSVLNIAMSSCCIYSAYGTSTSPRAHSRWPSSVRNDTGVWITVIHEWPLTDLMTHFHGLRRISSAPSTLTKPKNISWIGLSTQLLHWMSGVLHRSYPTSI